MPRRPDRRARDDEREAGEDDVPSGQPGDRGGEGSREQPRSRVDAEEGIERAAEQEG